jgi:hypothetical protein
MVHSARWTPAMQVRFDEAPKKSDKWALLKRYGFGVPRADIALRSARDALTLIAQEFIVPFEDDRMGEAHIFELPWPRDALIALGATSVVLRVTLSYFVDPNPASRGWRKRHSYASYGLKFSVRGPVETTDAFRKRMNRSALDAGEKKPPSGRDAADWNLGEKARNRGSLHSDSLETTAAELAARGVVGVYPVGGWWKDLPKQNRHERGGARYALVVSIEAPGVECDLWTPVAVQLGIENESAI